ncbi:carbonyl reductase [NADPH] 1-like [Pectinophora gossypiella]|uniref:carbonyl reductase [NADPH] 1-like n=1 Tax=Pectinophora gossypiella TaxID=13191 RepID=UPI00214ECF5D|nr:carbonyl reductase [NADPH] 1-like [Pectinophora gossypiella]
MADNNGKFVVNENMAGKVAVVTGANRGLGYEVVRALCERVPEVTVYLTARDEVAGLQAVQELNKLGLNPQFHQLDVTNKQSVANLADFIKATHGGFDYLVNNAAILDYEDVYPDYEAAKKNIDCNYRSLLTIEEYLFPLLREGARVVNISSACGHLSNLRNEAWIKMLKDPELTTEQLNSFVDHYLQSVRDGSFRRQDFADEGRHAEHRVSKVAVTALTMIQARKYASRHISVNALHPGHLATAMARGGGVTSPARAAALVLYALLDASPALSGAFLWHDRRLVDWYDHRGDYHYVHKEL